ncbi:hypothetical protein BUALT_Bualt13G0111400 [Buddleja alternifolia]|uniref:Uncharacterized protein n=1 Tax=Buddleja alternifolia TaxID=168488 RepID=A0AAV6WMB3_9LAMI|nr:hypothetical protein BUALT_Bualt13G0111400 [Buddleja alternifolia]
MDSLLANYASSDEESHEEQPPPRKQLIPPPKSAENQAIDEDFLPKSTSKRGGIFNSLPPPKSSLFNSMPPPKSQSFPNPNPKTQSQFEQRREEVGERDGKILENSKPKSSSSSLFSSIPVPKSSSSSSAAKRVVQFRPPTVVNTYSGGVDYDDDEDDEGEKERQRKRSKESISTSAPSSLSFSLPAPRYSATLGALPSASGTGRRSMLETDTPTSTVGSASEAAVVNSNVGHLGDQSNETYDHSSSYNGESYAYYSGNGVGSSAVSSDNTAGSDAGMNSNAGSFEVDYSYGNEQQAEYTDYNGSYADYGNNAQYENNWANVTALPEVSGVVGNALKLPGMRGRKDIPPEIIEVKQDELMKNRPREDQVKSTGIAFGPAYQPASTKGKPTKLHKRKHQIGALYFDMRQKETELAERRSKGFLTKAQTQAKYGWCDPVRQSDHAAKDRYIWIGGVNPINPRVRLQLSWDTRPARMTPRVSLLVA